MITLTQDGVEYTFEGYRYPGKGQHYITKHGAIWQGNSGPGAIRVVVKPVPVEHTFGNVVFVETGEVRQAKVNEWFLVEDALFPMYGIYTEKEYRILEPVRVNGQ